MNNYCESGRISRSLEEAFGPNCSQILITEPPVMAIGDMAVIATCVMALLALIVLV